MTDPRAWLAVLALTTPAVAQDFGPATVASSGHPGANAVVPAFVDGDGKLDLVIGEESGGRLLWVRQTAPGVFGSVQTVIDHGLHGTPWRHRVADLDGDGDQDVVATHPTGNLVAWYENQSLGGLWTPHVVSTGTSDPRELEVADLNGDGLLDVVFSGHLADEVLVAHNLGGGSFASPVPVVPSVQRPWAVGLGDLDGDGLVDLVTGEFFTGQVLLARNLGAGTWAAPVVAATGALGSSDLDAYDLDGDGDLDLLSAARVSGHLSWFENDGTGAFGPEQVVAILDAPYAADAADVDHDGDLDLCVAAEGEGSIRWFRNAGAGAFVSTTPVLGLALAPRDARFTDLDGDGAPDIAYAAHTSAVVGWHRNLNPPTPVVVDAVAPVHAALTGEVVVQGQNLAGATVELDGVPVAVTSSSDLELRFPVAPDLPGALHDVTIHNATSTLALPDALLRYPYLSGPDTVALGQGATLLLENGEPGVFVLALSGVLFPTPTTFPGSGWFHGLELNGTWFVGSGLVPGTLAVQLPGVSDPTLVGVPLHLQALASQGTSALAGFTNVVTVTLQ